jgi:hypothetical protein
MTHFSHLAPHGNMRRSAVTATLARWHLDEVFVKVNGWLEQANLRAPRAKP